MRAPTSTSTHKGCNPRASCHHLGQTPAWDSISELCDPEHVPAGSCYSPRHGGRVGPDLLELENHKALVIAVERAGNSMGLLQTHPHTYERGLNIRNQILLMVDTHLVNAAWPHVKLCNIMGSSTASEGDWIQHSAISFFSKPLFSPQ